MGRGRKKSVATRKGRCHLIILSEQAEITLREIKKDADNFDLSKYVSDHIIRDFVVSPEPYIKYQVSRLNEEISIKTEQIKHLQIDLENWRWKHENKPDKV